MPKRDTFYVTILRNTTQVYSSLFRNHYHQNQVLFDENLGYSPIFPKFTNDFRWFKKYGQLLPSLMQNFTRDRNEFLNFLRTQNAENLESSTNFTLQDEINYNSTMKFTKNNFMFDFGFPEFSTSNFEKNQIIYRNTFRERDLALTKILKSFDFILIAERLQESLILLADQLCWDLKDIVHVPLKVDFEKSELSQEDWPYF